jgi:ribosome biogenesis GTP-binding protein YsxC/EngB
LRTERDLDEISDNVKKKIEIVPVETMDEVLSHALVRMPEPASGGQNMEIRKAEFITSAVNAAGYPQDDLPHIAMVGKSNVGKSSLINGLTNQSKLARVSRQPGKTRLINFFLVNDSFYLVDLPGYGFARVSKAEKEKWGAMINEYFEKAAQLKCIIMIADIRHNPTAEDKQMAEWIQYHRNSRYYWWLPKLINWLKPESNPKLHN